MAAANSRQADAVTDGEVHASRQTDNAGTTVQKGEPQKSGMAQLLTVGQMIEHWLRIAGYMAEILRHGHNSMLLDYRQ
ncbi:hypothetical protein V6R21_05815 [Limibacter armeniacum]|uniref:hypothetical protein n=1 Tax=Limibacter armeniacum TaxID=466084 RepID=UPI002FE50F52